MAIGDPLQHETRAEIIDLLGDEVEVSTDEVRRSLPAKPKFESVAYHLLVLEQSQLVERVGGLWRRRRRQAGSNFRERAPPRRPGFRSRRSTM